LLIIFCRYTLEIQYIFTVMDALSCLGGQRSVSVVSTKTSSTTPSNYKIEILDNSDCSMDFFIAALRLAFSLSQVKACIYAMNIKSKGLAVLGGFTRDIAETKIDIAVQYAQKMNLEFKCILKRERGNYVIKKFGD